MGCGESMKVQGSSQSFLVNWQIEPTIVLVDYILFLTADVTITPNLNEVRDYKYVNKQELQTMFDDPSEIVLWLSWILFDVDICIGNSFTPWFKLIARDFLFGWWDELLKRKGAGGKVVAKSLNGIVDGSHVIKMS